MAVQDRASTSNKDLESIAQARSLATVARQAQSILAELSQEQIDAIVAAMADTVTLHAEALARLAVEETGYGVVADKVQKNLFSSRQVYEFIKPMKTVGVVNRIEDKKIIEIGKPFDNGVLCSSPNSVVVDEEVAEEVRRQFVSEGAYFMNAAEMDVLGKVLVTPQRLPNPALVGKPASVIAKQVGITVPDGTRAL